MMDLQDKIYVAGHQGLVGSAILRRLQEEARALVTEALKGA